MSTELFDRIIKRDHVLDEQGNAVPLLGEISVEQATALHNVVLERRPSLVLEVGMAHGVSTLAILSALAANGSGRLISIDPHQTTDWGGLGLASVAQYGLSEYHTLEEDYDYAALPRLLAAGCTVDLAYVDGWHTFDHVLLDFFYVDRMLPVGGLIGFNDCGFAAVHKALKFVVSHRSYEEADVGLRPDYAAATPVKSLARRALRWSRNDRYFSKRDDWTPAWNFYKRF